MPGPNDPIKLSKATLAKMEEGLILVNDLIYEAEKAERSGIGEDLGVDDLKKKAAAFKRKIQGMKREYEFE